VIQNNSKTYFTLRFAVAMCFIGHGTFGIITKTIWCNYFAVFGINSVMAYKLMPFLGTVDILLGLSVLFYPTKTVVAWLVVWGIITAALRPLSGEPIAELIERSGNFGAPLALLLLCSNGKLQPGNWFAKLKAAENIDDETLAKLTTCLKVVVFLLLIGHGWLNLIEKKGLMGQYAAIGFSNPEMICRVAGIFEIVAAITVLAKPLRGVLLVLLIWKMGTELFYPHWEIFEWVERGGSYGAILALWFVLPGLSVYKLGNRLTHSRNLYTN
jgi:hypothetical protein